MIVEVFTAGPLATHAILLGCSKTKAALVVDVPQGVVPSLLQRVQEELLFPKMILLTHSHWDHIADAAQLKKEWGVPLYLHEADRENLESPGSDGIPLWSPVTPTHPDGFVKDGDKLQLGEVEIVVLHTPGHTPGGVCYWIPQEQLLVSGDTLFKGGMGNLSLPTAQPEQMAQSLGRLSQFSQDTIVLPGHGERTTIGTEKWLQKYL